MTEEESEVFEITDFTTASDWERFIAKLEEVIHEWKLTIRVPQTPLKKGELTWGKWEDIVEEVQFADFKFLITHHFLKGENDPVKSSTAAAETPDVENKQVPGKDDQEEADHIPMTWQDMMSVDNDFPGRAHCLCRWYGIRDFVVLAPGPTKEDIMTESRANILLSSVAVAINNTSCQVPIFVQVHSRWRKLYLGHFEIPGFRTNYEMVHLKHIPKQYNHLAGLLDVFKAKLTSPVQPSPPVSVAVRFTYVLQEWALYNWSQAPPDIESASGENLGVTEFGDLPFGACEDPVGDLQLATTWPNLSEEMIVDDDVYSDLNPLQAPYWSVKVMMSDNTQCLLGDYLDEFIHLCKRKESTDQLLGKSILEDKTEEPHAGQALSRLTKAEYNLPTFGNMVSKTTTVVTKATSKLQIKPEEAPIATDLLNEILLFLFPDAKDLLHTSGQWGSETTGQGGSVVPEDKTSEETTQPSTEPSNNVAQDTFKQLKSAPSTSLTYRLAVVMCMVNHSYGGVRAVAHLWQEFVLEMRYRLENNITIPDLELGSPNMGCCLLHQKLQMLNCCIERKRARAATNESQSDHRRKFDADDEGLVKKKSKCSVKSKQTDGWDLESPSISSDEEFFECDDLEEDEPMEISNTSLKEVKQPQTLNQSDSSKIQTSQWDSNFGTRPSDSASQIHDDSQSELRTVVTPSDQSHLLQQFSSQSSRNDSDKSSVKSDARASSSQETDMDASFAESWSHMPEGRRGPHLHYTLINNPKELLYAPVTQEPAPMTEDMLDEQAEVLARLGTTLESQHLRARMQSACLLSDMESFKAANPGCVLGDFVRWYSPRDWIETEEMDDVGVMVARGQLSQRMQIPGNMWVEVWNSAKPTPARRQRRLFDDTKEAEKVLHWLASMKPASVAMRLMPMVVHAAVSKLLEQDESQLAIVKKVIEKVTSRSAKVMRAPRLELKKFEEIVYQLGQAEQVITRAQSLQQKFAHEKEGVNITARDIHMFVSDLLEFPEVSVPRAAQSPIGIIIHRLFQEAHKSAYVISAEEDEEDEDSPVVLTNITTSPGNATASANTTTTTTTSPTDLSDRRSSRVAIPDFPKPWGKEFILRTTVSRPAPWSRLSPQRMYCILVKNEFRLLGAFSSDTTFQ